MRRVSVIIPTLNEAESLPHLLGVLRAWRDDACEVIVVDGGSTDATVAQVTRAVDRVIQTERGRAVQLNAGAAVANGDVLWFLHADTLPPADGLRLVRGAIASGYGWGRFDVRLSGTARLLRVVEWMMNRRSRFSGIATGDQAIFVRRDWFRAGGGFPEIALMEDIAFSRTMKRRGPPAALRARALTSSRRWERGGVMKTILKMWVLRLAFFLGADPQRLARSYRHG